MASVRTVFVERWNELLADLFIADVNKLRCQATEFE